MKKYFDIIIVGAGPAGLSFANFLAGSGLDIAVIEKSSKAQIESPAYDGREIAFTHLSKKIMTDGGQWQRIPESNISIIKDAEVLNEHSRHSLHFNSIETDKPNLGFMVSNHIIRKAAYDAVKNKKDIKIIYGREAKAITPSDRGYSITLDDGAQLETLLLVAADSRFSSIRRMAGVACDMLDFGRTCIVCKMDIEASHDKTATEWFDSSRTLAILPLQENEVSVVLTLDSATAPAVMAMSVDDFSRDIEKSMNSKFGSMRLSTERYAYPLVATYARRFYTGHLALIGDAAVGMHPVTAHGFNLGIKSAHTLAEKIRAAIELGGDFSSQSILEDYNRTHRKASRTIYLGTNHLVRLYTRKTPVARFARNLLLRIANRVTPAKKLIMNRLTEIAA